jgi:hypothetical protein
VLHPWTRDANLPCSERILGQPVIGGGCVNEDHRIRLGHESLDVTLAYLKGKEAESEEAQEHANSSSLALYA